MVQCTHILLNKIQCHKKDFGKNKTGKRNCMVHNIQNRQTWVIIWLKMDTNAYWCGLSDDTDLHVAVRHFLLLISCLCGAFYTTMA